MNEGVPTLTPTAEVTQSPIKLEAPVPSPTFEDFNMTPPSQLAEIQTAVSLGVNGNTKEAIDRIAHLPTPTEATNQTAEVIGGEEELNTPHPDGPLKATDASAIAESAAASLNEPPDEEQKPATAPPGMTDSDNAAASDFAAAGKKEEIKLPYGMTKSQYEKSQKDHYAREVANGRVSQEDADRKVAESVKNYDEQYNKDNPEAVKEQQEAEAKLTPEQKTAAIIENIRNGEGDLMENLVALENVQANMHGEELTAEMRNTLADLLQTQIETQGKLENKEAITVLQQISEMIGMEAQLRHIPEQLDVLDKKADKLDDQIGRMQKEIRFNNTALDQKERNELYDAYVMLTQTEAQMVHLSQLQDKMAQRYKEVSNNIDYTLGRKGGFSYALGAVRNSFGRVTLNLSRPSLRSTRHRKYFGF